MTLGVRYDFDIDQGASLEKRLAYRDSSGTIINMSPTAFALALGYAARMTIRESFDAIGIIDQLDVQVYKSDSSRSVLTLSDGTGGYNIRMRWGTLVTKDYDFDTAVYTLEVVQARTPTAVIYPMGLCSFSIDVDNGDGKCVIDTSIISVVELSVGQEVYVFNAEDEETVATMIVDSLAANEVTFTTTIGGSDNADDEQIMLIPIYKVPRLLYGNITLNKEVPHAV